VRGYVKPRQEEAGCKKLTWRIEVQMFNNKLFSMNLFRLVQFDNIQRGSPFHLSGGTRSRGVKNATDLAPVVRERNKMLLNKQ